MVIRKLFVASLISLSIATPCLAGKSFNERVNPFLKRNDTVFIIAKGMFDAGLNKDEKVYDALCKMYGEEHAETVRALLCYFTAQVQEYLKNKPLFEAKE